MPRASLVLLVLAACGPAREEPARRPNAPAPPTAAPAPDPMSEASLAADLAWLTAPERAGRGSTVGLPAEPAIAGAARKAAAEAGLSLVAVRPGLVEIVGEARRSDDWVFRDAGVHAVHFSTGLHDDYHSPRDTLDRMSRPQVMRVARFLRALVDRTARQRARSLGVGDVDLDRARGAVHDVAR